MYEKIVRLAFEKAGKNVVSNSIKAKSEYLESTISNLFDDDKENDTKNFVLNAKTYSRYYNKYVTKKSNDFINPSQNVLDGLAKFLDYTDFNHFKKENNTPNNKLKTKLSQNKNTTSFKTTASNTKKQLSEIEINGLLKLVNPLYIGLILVVLLTSIWILNGLFFNTIPEPVPQTIIYNTYNGNLNYYYTEKENGEIVLYKNTDELPNNTLKPVTQKVILTYFKQKNIDVSNEDTKRWFKEEIGSEILKQNSNAIETTKAKKHVKPLSNLAVQNTKVTIKSNKNIDNIMSVYFKNTYEKTTLKYIATGNVSYTFKESSFIKDATVCKLVLTYNVKLINSDTLFDLNTITSTATGFSMLDAKNKAIDKLQFN